MADSLQDLVSTSTTLPLFKDLKLIDRHDDKSNISTLPTWRDNPKSISKLCEEKLDEYLAQAKPNNEGNFSFQNQSLPEIAKHNEELNLFSISHFEERSVTLLGEKLKRDFENIKRTKHFPNTSYRFPVSNEPTGTNFVINPEQINPVLKASEDRIKALEDEV